jgi:hypothetical protein
LRVGKVNKLLATIFGQHHPDSKKIDYAGSLAIIFRDCLKLMNEMYGRFKIETSRKLIGSIIHATYDVTRE